MPEWYHWESHHHLCTAGDKENTGENDEQLQIGLLAGIVMMMVVMAAAVLLSVYMYNHPTSNASLFFMEVSDSKNTRTFLLKRPCLYFYVLAHYQHIARILNFWLPFSKAYCAFNLTF